MNIRKQRKQKLKYLPRYNQGGENLFANNCCKSCYFGYGRFFSSKHLYNHDAAEDNYDGLLKKYWKNYSSYGEEDAET
jgi:hypothetical protein